MTRIYLREENSPAKRDGYLPDRQAGRRGYADARPKLWLVCPGCDKLAGFVFPDFVKRSGEPRRGGTERPVPATPPDHERGR